MRDDAEQCAAYLSQMVNLHFLHLIPCGVELLRVLGLRGVETGLGGGEGRGGGNAVRGWEGRGGGDAVRGWEG